MAEKGAFIVIDGIDGSGKSTQAKLLAEWLRKKGKTVLSLHEPSNDNPLGRKIKKLVRSEKTSKKELIKLFEAERKFHSRKIKEALDEGKFVIFDRYYYSTMAYQLEKKEWKGYASKFIKPDVAFILDLTINEALRRINEKNEKQHLKLAIFERALVLSEVKWKFGEIAKIFREAKIINAEKSPQSMLRDITKEVSRMIGRKD